MTLPVLLLSTLALSTLAPLLATAVALLAPDPTRRADARRVLHLLLTSTRQRPPTPPPPAGSGRLRPPASSSAPRWVP